MCGCSFDVANDLYNFPRLYILVLLAGVAGALVVLNRLLCRVVQVKLLCMVDFDARWHCCCRRLTILYTTPAAAAILGEPKMALILLSSFLYIWLVYI